MMQRRHLGPGLRLPPTFLILPGGGPAAPHPRAGQHLPPVCAGSGRSPTRAGTRLPLLRWLPSPDRPFPSLLCKL